MSAFPSQGRGRLQTCVRLLTIRPHPPSGMRPEGVGVGADAAATTPITSFITNNGSLSQDCIIDTMRQQARHRTWDMKALFDW